MSQNENVLTGVVRDESLWGLWCRQARSTSGFRAPRVSTWVSEQDNLGDKIEMLEGAS